MSPPDLSPTRPWAVEAAEYIADPTDDRFGILASTEIDYEELLDVAYRAAAARTYALPALAHLCKALLFARHLVECAWFLRQLERVAPTVDTYRLSAHAAALRGDVNEVARIHNLLVQMKAPVALLAMTAQLAYLVIGDNSKLTAVVAAMRTEDLVAERLLPSIHLQASLRLRHSGGAVDALLGHRTNGLEVEIGKRQLDDLVRLLRTHLVALIGARTRTKP